MWTMDSDSEREPGEHCCPLSQLSPVPPRALSMLPPFQGQHEPRRYSRHAVTIEYIIVTMAIAKIPSIIQVIIASHLLSSSDCFSRGLPSDHDEIIG